MIKNTILESLGIEVIELKEGLCIATMPVDHRTHQPYGFLHGGASVVLAETVASVGTSTLIDSEKEICFGLEINANHIRPKQSGVVTAHGELIHHGKTTAVWNIRLVDEQEKLICFSRCTVAIKEK